MPERAAPEECGPLLSWHLLDDCVEVAD